MVKLHFELRDVFRSGRYAFSAKKISIHFLGLAAGYLVYEILVYGSLLIAGGGAAKTFWNTYALWPVFPFVDADFDWLTLGAMWLGTLALFVLFFFTSAMVSKVTIEQLRGDNFLTIDEAFHFAKAHGASVYVPFISLLLIIFLIALPLLVIGLLGKIPVVGQLVMLGASVLTPLAFCLGVLTAYLFVIFGLSLFFSPSIVAAADSDTFETVYQHFAVFWHQPWRVILYEVCLFGVKSVCVPIWALFSLVGFGLAMVPIRWLLPTDMKIFMGYANEWLGRGRLIAKIAEFPYVDKLKVFQIASPENLPVDTISAFDLLVVKATAVGLTIGIVCIVGIIFAYLLSIASVGNTIIYTVIRRRVDGENLLVPTKIPVMSHSSDVESEVNSEEKLK